MKKLLFMIVVFGGIMSLKGNVSLTPDNQVHLSRWSFAVPPAVQASPFYSMVSLAMSQSLTPTPVSAVTGSAMAPRNGAAQPLRPAMPNVTNTNGTYNANAPSGPTQETDQFATVTKALR